MDKYRDALAAVPSPGEGRTHGWMLGAANHAAAAGVDAATAEREIGDALGPRAAARRAEVRAAVEKAYREHGARGRLGLGALPPPQPKPRPAPLTAQEYIRRGGGRTEADLWEASPVHPSWEPVEGWRDACALLRAMFKPGELVACGEIREDAGKQWWQGQVRPCAEWCGRFRGGEWIPPLVRVNPIKPEGGKTRSGKPSMVCDDAVAVFRHAVVEFDAMPLADQLNFWMGWGLEAVTAITFSGGKSLHAVLRVDVANREEWEREVRGGLYRRRMVPFGCDWQCANPSRGTRLAGARRADKGGAVQKLLFVREALA